MKGIPIKFRGVNIVEHTTLKKGETICGKVLMQYENGKFWLGNETGTYVDPDSVVHLVGYDTEETKSTKAILSTPFLEIVPFLRITSKPHF